MWLFNGQVEDSTEGDYFFYPLTGTEHGSQPSVTTHDRELVSVLEVRIEHGYLNPRPLTQQSVTLPTLPRAGYYYYYYYYWSLFLCQYLLLSNISLFGENFWYHYLLFAGFVLCFVHLSNMYLICRLCSLLSLSV